ncbi:baculoviral IAP repeat-containing protein 7-like [Mytilus edulis]|uniref:baculoviral IAP repeat-containing protein 7-like n=1 Tax=Mytilus edulis TaxID=6550 RepID=UPI0039EE83E1
MCCTETSDIVLQGKHQTRAIDSRMYEPRVFQRSFSDTGQGPLMLSRSVQTDLTPESTCLQDTDDTHKIDMTSYTKDDKGYEKVCSDLKELKDKVQQLTSAINLSGPAQIPEIINRLKTFAKIKEKSTNLRLTIERLETMVEKTMSSDVEHIINHQEFTAIRYGTALNNIDTVSKVQNESSLQKNKESYNVLGDLLRVHIFPQSKSLFCPLSLRTYFESFSSDTPVSHVDSMSNELLRVSSYSNFPRDISINLIKMAKTGFYYIDGRKTKCFSCGITYDKWKSDDDPVVIHKMLSPSCALLAEPRFASSSNQQEQTTVVPNNTDSTVDTTTVTSQGLNQSENASSRPEPRLQISSSYNGTSNNVQERPEHQIRSPSNRDKTSSATGNENSQETQTSNENHNATETSSGQHKTEFESLGIHLEKPKYPNYACLTVRISSFEGWPSYLDQSPRQMALAGFLFAGYHDYTRCFFCGGGLRNWEAGDDPWVEHARWFQKCTFLKQNKGEKFIHAVQKRQAEIDRETNATNENKQETTSRAQTSSSAVNTSTTSTTQSDILQTVAARSVIEMGYTDQQVINAFQLLTTSGKDLHSISATDVMHILLDDEAHPQQQGATADVTQHGHNTNRTGDHTSDSTSTRCNGLDNTVDEQSLLFDDTENLIEENRQLRDQRLCKVCLDLEATIAFLPCGHIVCCIDCAPAMRKCPVCRTYVKGTVKTYLA